MEAKTSGRPLKRLLKWIEHHLPEPLPFETLARRLGTTPFTFYRHFERVLGETPRQYIERQRLHRAALLIAFTDSNMGHIGRVTGFPWQEVFTKAFIRHYGITPTTLRRRIQRRLRATQGQAQLTPVEVGRLSPAVLLSMRCARVKSPALIARPLWARLRRYADNHGRRRSSTTWCLDHDILGLASRAHERVVPCIKIDRQVDSNKSIACVTFEGGWFASIRYRGTSDALIQAYAALVRYIVAQGDRFALHSGPAVLIQASARNTSTSPQNLTTIHFPVTRLTR